MYFMGTPGWDDAWPHPTITPLRLKITSFFRLTLSQHSCKYLARA
jgi:hypothetical protein